MKRSTARCIAFAIFALLLPAAAQAPAPQPASLVGPVTIAAIKGEVAIHALDGGSVASARGQLLAPGTVIETKKGSIVFDLADGSQAQVKGNTRVVIKDPAKDQFFSLELLIGKVVTKIKKKLNAEPSFRMGTPTAVITVRGTEFLTEVDKNGKTQVFVYEGVVEVQGILPGSRPVFVRPGFWTEVPPHRPASEPMRIDFDQRMAGPQGNGSGRPGSDTVERSQPTTQPSSQPSSGEREKPD